MASAMQNGARPETDAGGDLEHVDVLIIGAGLSGIGAACHLKAKCPGKSIAILEARECIGGTWDLFRYPGIRSDSDMYTLGYSFRPWAEAKSIADGPSILSYVRETAAEHGVEEKIRFQHRALRAEFDSASALWTVHALREDSGEEMRIRAGFVLMCSGYYRYDEGYSPEFPGSQRFTGRIVHPQKWTDDIDTHFKPTYNPWEQRLCLVPDGDLFEAIAQGRASVVTDSVETFTETGIRLASGEELEADVIVTATGLNLIALGGMQLSVDGREIDISQTLGYKGMMLSDVPNLALTFGYTNASWTLKCDLTCAYVGRLLNHMDAHGFDTCVAINDDPTLGTEPFLDFSSGYVQRAISKF